MTYPDPHVTDSGVPEVEQADFEKEVARRQARLEADRVANRPASLPVTPAEERTGAAMKVYVAMIADRHTDPEPEVFTTAEAAIGYVEQWARAHARVAENIIEEEVDGWLHCLEYSPEGDSVWVVEKELDAPGGAE